MKTIRKLKNRKLNSKRVLGLASLILTSTMVVACDERMARKEYECNRIEFSSDGISREARQYRPFNSEESINNSFIEYSAWELRDDGRYQREIKEYDAAEVTYEEIRPLLDKDFNISEVFGKPTKIYFEVSDTLSDEEIQRGAYYEGTIYSVNTDKYVIVKEPMKHVGILIVSGGTVTIGLASLIAWEKYNEKINKEQEKKLTLKKRD